MMAMKRLFCFGAGFSAQALARLLAKDDWQVEGTARRSEKTAGFALHRYGPEALLEAAGLDSLRSATHLLVSIPPDEDGDPVLRDYGAVIAAKTDWQWIGYLSTTGVYGDHGGALVDEMTPPTPTTERGRRRLKAEQDWLRLYRVSGLPVHIFRLAGIYGPSRSAFDALREGRARIVDKPGQLFSRIHVADIARVLKASIERPQPGAIYNVCDDLAAPSGDVTRHAAALLGVAPPAPVAFAEAALPEMARSFYADNKRVSNRRIREELGVDLLYPDYRAGLEAIFQTESGKE